jgi:tripartite-type tricarboxylate transporter receptor subunit TctC
MLSRIAAVMFKPRRAWCAPRAQRRASIASTAALLACLSVAGQGVAVDPVARRKPRRMIVPYAPGGVVDLIARIFEPELERQWGYPLILEHRPGAGGTIGAALVARAEPDGQTLLMGDVGSLLVAPRMLSRPSFDIERDFSPVSVLGEAGNVLVVLPSSPVRSVPDLIAWAAAKRGALSFGSAGIGSTSFRAAVQLLQRGQVQAIHVPYKGGGPALLDLLGGQLSFIVASVSSALPEIRAGRLRALGVTTPQRLAVLPTVPAISESLPGFVESNWIGLLVPAGTPADLVAQLHRGAVRALESTDIRHRLEDIGIAGVGSSPSEFADRLRRETDQMNGTVTR